MVTLSDKEDSDLAELSRITLGLFIQNGPRIIRKYLLSLQSYKTYRI